MRICRAFIGCYMRVCVCVCVGFCGGIVGSPFDIVNIR